MPSRRFIKLPTGPKGTRGVESINPSFVESVKSYMGGCRVRMASGVQHLTPLKKRVVFKLLNISQR